MIHATEADHHFDAEARLRAKAPRLQAVVDEIREALDSRSDMPGASRHALECVLVGLSQGLSRGWEVSEASAEEVRALLARVAR